MVVAMTLPMVAATDMPHTIAVRTMTVTTVMMVAWEQTDSPPVTLDVNTRMAMATMEEDGTTYRVTVEGVTSNKSMVKKISFSWTMLLA